MTEISDILAVPRPASLAEAQLNWPERSYSPSPADWRRECLYFFLPDRFSDVIPADRGMLYRQRLRAGRLGPAGVEQEQWPAQTWLDWGRSGFARFQGGTLEGAASQLPYLEDLGVGAVWVGPVWKQAAAPFAGDVVPWADNYHGYAVQDFLDVDPRFGSRRDLVEFVDAAHERGIKVIFDIIVNHTGRNFTYRLDGDIVPLEDGPYYDHGRRYDFGAWLDREGKYVEGPDTQPFEADDAVWPREFRDRELYQRRGERRTWDDGHDVTADDAPFRVFDMFGRDLDLGQQDGRALRYMIDVWSYWLALTDCDGFRVDTIKHIPEAQARTLCDAISEYAESLGKDNFLLVGEVGPGKHAPDENLSLEERYLRILRSPLDAVLALEARPALRECAYRAEKASEVLGRFADPDRGLPSSYRLLGSSFVTTIDDHDGLGASVERFPFKSYHRGASAADAVETYFWPLQAVPGIAHLLLTLGIPCLYYGLEQGMAGPAVGDLSLIPGWQVTDGGSDRYLREAMFGPRHPRRLGVDGVPNAPGEPTEDPAAVGFGPFGTSGVHLFDREGAVFRRAKLLLATRRTARPLQAGRQYWRPVSTPGSDPWGGSAVDGLVAWSRILADQEYVVVVNVRPPDPDGAAGTRTGQVAVDNGFHPPGSGLRVVASTAQCDGRAGHLDRDTVLPVVRPQNNHACVVVADLPPHEALVLARAGTPQ